MCAQIQKYACEQELFDLDIGYAKDGPIDWWKYISTEPEPDVLPRLACHLFAICPNSASCERRFSTLGWLFHKRRLNLGLERLEAMCKMILYWKSNSKTELEFYGIDSIKNTRLNNDDINLRIAEAFAEMDDEKYSDEQRVTTGGEVIPEDNCCVVIESIWIDRYIDLSHNLITNEIGNILADILEYSDEDDEDEEDGIDEEEVGVGDYNKRDGVGDFDYDVNDILGDDNGDDNYDNE